LAKWANNLHRKELQDLADKRDAEVASLRTQEEAVEDAYQKMARTIAENTKKGSGREGLKDDLDARNRKKRDEDADALREAKQKEAQAFDEEFAKEREKLALASSQKQLEYDKALRKKLISEEKHAELTEKLHRETNRKIAEMNMALAQESVDNAGLIFGSLAEASKRSGAEQSGVYKTMFAAQKAFAVASAGVSMAVGMGKAMELGWPAGIPAGLAAAAEGAKIIAMISAANYSGAHDLGGRIPAGSIGLVGERGPELVRGPADVTSRADTAKMMGGGSPNITVNASFDPHEAVNRYLSSTQGVRTVNIHLQKNHRTIQALGNR
jgi:hypothetical protein